jgi:hypothetical protein
VNSLYIDKLSLELPGYAAEDGRNLALDIVAALAAAGALPEAGDYPALRVEVPAAERRQGPNLTARIVAEVLRQLRRDSG